MAYFQCSKCKEAYLVNTETLDAKSSLLARLPCPNSLVCKSVLRRVKKAANSYTLYGISAENLYKACMGGGFPSERQCSPEDLRKAMIGSKVTKITAKESPDPDRSILVSITLDNGKTVYLANSVHGATVFKITED